MHLSAAGGCSLHCSCSWCSTICTCTDHDDFGYLKQQLETIYTGYTTGAQPIAPSLAIIGF
jgi:hypothetical protein